MLAILYDSVVNENISNYREVGMSMILLKCALPLLDMLHDAPFKIRDSQEDTSTSVRTRDWY